jgi:hypothetical protein
MLSKLCNLLGHGFDDWQYEAPDSCVQVRTCKRCGQREERNTPHAWEEWRYVALSAVACAEMRVCTRCGHKQLYDFPHDFGVWAYQEPDNCRQVQTCQNCGYQRHKVLHHYSEWRSADSPPTSCKRVRTCGRCGHVDLRYFPHVWGEWESDETQGGVQVRVCTACGYQERQG